MLVHFNHGTAAWPTFTAFLRYRRKLAALAGIELDRMEGFGGAREWSTVSDDLRPFLSMADVTGFVPATECGRVARRLRTFADFMAVDLPDHELTLKLADGVLEAAEVGHAFRFAPRRGRPVSSDHPTSVAHALVGFVTRG